MRGIVTTAVSTAGLIVALAVAPAAHAADK